MKRAAVDCRIILIPDALDMLLIPSNGSAIPPMVVEERTFLCPVWSTSVLHPT